jgi:hypothetical protein
VVLFRVFSATPTTAPHTTVALPKSVILTQPNAPHHKALLIHLSDGQFPNSIEKETPQFGQSRLGFGLSPLRMSASPRQPQFVQ